MFRKQSSPFLLSWAPSKTQARQFQPKYKPRTNATGNPGTILCCTVLLPLVKYSDKSQPSEFDAAALAALLSQQLMSRGILLNTVKHCSEHRHIYSGFYAKPIFKTLTHLQ